MAHTQDPESIDFIELLATEFAELGDRDSADRAAADEYTGTVRALAIVQAIGQVESELKRIQPVLLSADAHAMNADISSRDASGKIDKFLDTFGKLLGGVMKEIQRDVRERNDAADEAEEESDA